MGDVAHPIQPTPENTVDCPWCGSSQQSRGRQCSACGHTIVNLPQWAEVIPRRHWLTRNRIIGAGVALLILVVVAWINYPFLPNPVILLFNRPSTSLTSDAVPGQWSMAGGTLGQTKALAQNSPLLHGESVWSVDLGAPTQSTPIVSNGVVFLGGYKIFLALDSRTGDVLWEWEITGPMHGSAAVSGDLVYLPLIDRRLVALDRSSGELVWEFEAQDQIIASPVVADGIVYIGSWDGKLYARDAANGGKIWTYDANGRISHPVALHRGWLAVTGDAGQVHILNARTGQKRLIYRTTRSASDPPVAADDRVYFPSDGWIYAIDGNEKEIPWQFQFKIVWTQLWLWQVPGVPKPPGQQGGVWRYDPAGSGAAIISAPASSQGILYVGDLQGGFHAVDALTGQETWSFSAEGRIFGSPVVAGSWVYFGTDAGFLYALRRSDGKQQWRRSLGAPVKLPAAYSGDRLFVRTEDGTLHAVE